MMKFGIESEKILYDTRLKTIGHTAYRLLDALNDYKVVYGNGPIERVLGEFTLNMIELTSSPSSNLLEVARDYIFSYELIRDVAARSGVTPLPIGSYPCDFQPIMAPKWRYFVQNAILSNNAKVGWHLAREHKMYDAANCAGVHIHLEIETPSEFITLNSEFITKHNIASLLSPLVAFASSPYSGGVNEAVSMRARNYYFGIYDEFPQFGGMPLVAEDSKQIVQFYYDGINHWEERGVSIGIDRGDIRRITNRGGANWGFVRWNRKWNTIELRFLDTDFVDMNLAKLAIVGGLARVLTVGWQLKVAKAPIFDDGKPYEFGQVIAESVENLVDSKNRIVNIPNQVVLHEIIKIAVKDGLKNDLVYKYVSKLVKLAVDGLEGKERWLVGPILYSLKSRKSTSDLILDKMCHKKTVKEEDIVDVLESLICEETERFQKVRLQLPKDLQPPNDHPFPQGELDLFLEGL